MTNFFPSFGSGSHVVLGRAITGEPPRFGMRADPNNLAQSVSFGPDDRLYVANQVVGSKVFTGRVEQVTPDYFIQRVGPDVMIAHDRNLVMGEIPMGGQVQFVYQRDGSARAESVKNGLAHQKRQVANSMERDDGAKKSGGLLGFLGF